MDPERLCKSLNEIIVNGDGTLTPTTLQYAILRAGVTKGKTEIPFTLHGFQNTGRLLRGVIKIESGMIAIGFDGYGEHGAEPGYGTPILIEYGKSDFDGKPTPWVRIFEDINGEEVTSIALSGAAEKLRKG